VLRTSGEQIATRYGDDPAGITEVAATAFGASGHDLRKAEQVLRPARLRSSKKSLWRA
jgi:hypothetical protein